MRITRSRAFAALALSATAALALAGCTPGGEGEDDPYAKLTLGMTADITGWDPSAQPSYQSWGIEAVYDNLVRCVPGDEIVPAAAESWEYSDDNRSFTAHLREGMTFTDGSPVDSAAVQRSFEDLIETASDRYGGITFDTPDDLTITITWPDPQPLLKSRVCSPYLASIAYLDGDDRAGAPVGSGPYTLDVDATTSGSVYSFVKNPDFYDADNYPYQTLELRVLADPTASLNALKTGQIEGTVITADTYQEATDAGLEVISKQAGLTMLNLGDREGAVIPALGNVDVRRAINMVFDKQSIVDNLYAGQAVPIHQPLAADSVANLENFEDPYPFDVEEAQQLMADSGFGDGFTITLPTMEGQAWTVMLPYVTQQLALLNITVEQEALTGPDAIANLLSGDYPVVLWTVGSPTSLQDITIHVLASGYWNVLHQADPTVDALWQDVLTGDAETQVQAQKDINAYIIDQAWFAPILSPNVFYAYDSAKVDVPQFTDMSNLHPRLIDFK